MKFRSSCCCWLTLLLVGSNIISVSPNSSTTGTTTFQKHRKQSIYIQNSGSSSTGLLPTAATNNFESLENYHFASATMPPEPVPLSQHQYQQQLQLQQQQQQHIPDSMATTSVYQMVTFITTPPPSSISRKTSSSLPSSSSSSLAALSSSSSSSSSSTMSTKATASATSVEINSNAITRRRREISTSMSDDESSSSLFAGSSSSSSSSSSSALAVTGAMVHHHYPVRNTTESYPSMFFQMNAPPKEQHQQQHQYRRQISNKRSKRDEEMNDDAGMDKCLSFVEGDPEQSLLFSPDYPNDYPKNINCTRIIEAPKGQLIRLDFRNSFNIEDKEDCKFDYLEIRDGPYGFSNLIGRFCGEDFPPMITSKERHLWLHFHSDESIEYSGFTAVYEFIDRPKEAISTELNCTLEKDGYEGFINSTDVPAYVQSNVTKYKIPLDCMWIIKVKENWKIQIKFIHFSLNKPNDCEINFIDIFAEDTNIPSRVKNFCGSTGEPVSSESNILHIRFFAEYIAMNSSFNILYTAFRDKGTGACVKDEEYDCEDATCIAANLQCNGRTNCKFRWDEEGCESQVVGQSEHVIIIIVVFGLILGGMIVTFLVNCVRKIMRDQKIIREVPAGIYHIDSYVRDAPKTAIFVGLQDDFFIDYPEILTPSSTCPTLSPSSSSSSSTQSQVPEDEFYQYHHHHHYDEINTNKNHEYNKEYNNNNENNNNNKDINNLDNYSCNNNNHQQDYNLDSPNMEDHSVSF
ncbi:neuropilin and tolloid-like protein 1 isoform X2 [Episyrphus balteatus]|uniref:neuropilin and tolloid-like protein 1 isoform X2 n=1 Tax=Episyrphus balteatus TaxID=286459 RepID=UPI002486BC65|nr:neuropilin and tolloid-like protein 1 isoform X2 [Episyrphus balteatus]